MIESIIDAISYAFTQVANLVGGILGSGFNAVAELSSGVFGGEEAAE